MQGESLTEAIRRDFVGTSAVHHNSRATGSQFGVSTVLVTSQACILERVQGMHVAVASQRTCFNSLRRTGPAHTMSVCVPRTGKFSVGFPDYSEDHFI